MTEFSGPSFDQYLIVMGFFVAIFAIFLLLKRIDTLFLINYRIKKRMKVSDVTLLGQGDRALILKIDDKDFLFISGKNSGAILTEIKNENNPKVSNIEQAKLETKNKKALEIRSLIEKALSKMKSKFVVNFSLIFIFLLTNSLNAQEITSGLEALNL